MPYLQLAYPIAATAPKTNSSRGRRHIFTSACALASVLVSVMGLVGPSARAQAAAAANTPADASTIRVAAAADLQTVMPTLAAAYKHATGIDLNISYGSSSTLTTQILNGEPVDLFLSADYLFPEKLVAAKLADARDPTPYARGTLVLWARKDSPLQPLHLEALTDPRVRTVAIANPEHAPYGRASVSALAKLHIDAQVKPKFVVAENIAQAGQFADSGNAQLGLLSLSLALSPHFKETGTYVLVPTVYPEIRQCAVVLAASPRRAEAHAFLDWLTSPEIQSNLPKLGLSPVR